MIRWTRIFLLFVLGSATEASFYERHAEGWFWYQDPKLMMEETEKLEEFNKTKKEKLKTLEEKASETLVDYKKKLEQKLHLALVSPTPANVQSYMVLQKDMMERSNQFSKTWQQMVVMNPELNTETQFPTAQYARHVQDEQTRQTKEKTIRKLSQSFGLFYFFKENCAYCTAFAPIVKMFSEQYQWDVMAISMDGSASPVFAHTQRDNGMAEALNIKGVPALVAYNTETEELIPISYAATSLDQLEDNIMTLIGNNK